VNRKFETYEQVATFLLNEFALHFGLDRVEGKQDVPGLLSGTTWEIDAKGVKAGDGAFIIVECRRHTTSRPNQEDLAALAYRILDAGAIGGIIVTPLGIQEGAARVACAARIISVRLDPASTTRDYVLQFLNNVMIGASLTLSSAVELKLSADVVRRCARCGEEFAPNSTEVSCPDRARQDPCGA
jgi:hypothetical protein